MDVVADRWSRVSGETATPAITGPLDSSNPTLLVGRRSLHRSGNSAAIRSLSSGRQPGAPGRRRRAPGSRRAGGLAGGPTRSKRSHHQPHAGVTSATVWPMRSVSGDPVLDETWRESETDSAASRTCGQQFGPACPDHRLSRSRSARWHIQRQGNGPSPGAMPSAERGRLRSTLMPWAGRGRRHGWWAIGS